MGPGAENQVAYVGTDRQIHIRAVTGGEPKQVSFSMAPGPLSRWGGTAGRDAWAWPCFSPDGRWLSCFQFAEGDELAGQASVVTVEIEGVEMFQLQAVENELPIYAQWSPDGAHLALLTQDQDELALYVVPAHDQGRRHLVEQGVPLFFTWLGDAHRLMVHHGSQEDHPGRLTVRDGVGTKEDIVHGHDPGTFCTPLRMAGGLVYAVHNGPHSVVVLTDETGRVVRRLLQAEGLLALVADRESSAVLVGAAPGGEGTPYTQVWRAPLDGSAPEQVLQVECLAFFAVPGGARVVFVTQAEQKGWVEWWCVEAPGMPPRQVARARLTRDELFRLYFFEQFAESHPVLTPDGRHLVFATHMPNLDGQEQPPVVVVVDLDLPDLPARPLARGSFAVCAPQPAEG